MEFTEEQLAEIEKAKKEAVEKALAEQEGKHKAEMAKLRIDAKNEKEEAVKKAEENAKLTEEQRVKKELEEKQKQEHEELLTLREKIKLDERKEKLVAAGVPEMFKNDSRLKEAEDDKVDEVINTIKTEWQKIAPQQQRVDTNVSGRTNQNETDEFANFRGLGIGKKR